MYETDNNMLKAFEILKKNGDVRFFYEIYDVLGVDNSWVRRIKKQEEFDRAYHFTAEHIRIFCKTFGVNSNYINGLETQFYLKNRVTKTVTKKGKTIKLH